MNIRGKHNEAIIYTGNVDKETISQVTELCNQEFTRDSKIRIMPDCHKGAGCTIGTTMTITDKVVPNLVGVDIGCGMITYKLNVKELDLEKLDSLLGTEVVPSGFGIKEKQNLKFTKHINLKDLKCHKYIDKERALRSLGSLGGGNHFCELSKDDEGTLYLIIHSGSRHLGKQVCDYYQGQAIKQAKHRKDEQVKNIIANCKYAGAEEVISKLIQEHVEVVPRDLSYLEGGLFEDYLHDMRIVQRYAELNREAMGYELFRGLGLDPIEVVEEYFHTVHNYIDLQSMILRKGAVSAKKGETLLIPINMSDGSLLCRGKGNPEWNYSAPHGAGRVLSRAQAKALLSIDDYKSTMTDVYTTSVTLSTIDEAPQAYKPLKDIVDNIGDTVEIVAVLKPVYNYKAH